MNDVAIYFLDKGFPIVTWLCRKCLAERKDEGWEIKDRKKAPHALSCDGCHWKAMEAS